MPLDAEHPARRAPHAARNPYDGGNKPCASSEPHEPHTWTLAAIDGNYYDCPGVPEPPAATTPELVETIRRGIGNIGTYVTATGEPVTREGKERKAALEALDTLLRLIAEADGYLSFFYYQGEMPNDREQLNDLISRLRAVNRG